jgi:4-hydroxybenzoate polyprenyltransferase
MESRVRVRGNLAVQPCARAADGARPLIVDLDGTLLRTDLLIETASAYVIRNPLRAFSLLAWSIRGRPYLKARLAAYTSVDVATLPYNEPLLAWLREQKDRGTRLVLATATHRALAEAVASHMGLFDEVLATETRNLKGPAKAERLTQRFGAHGFDYLGDHRSDLPAWAACRRAWLVAPDRPLQARAGRLGLELQPVVPREARALRAWWRALRVHQWLKNLLVLVPLVSAHRLTSAGDIASAAWAVVCFCLLASGAYLVNDLADVAEDRRHATKRARPFANGDLPLAQGWVAAPLLVALSLALAYGRLPLLACAWLVAYFGLALAYSLRLKQTLLLDVVTLSILYTLRLLAGAAAIEVPVSIWLLTFALFIFTSLALIKRYAELFTLGHVAEAAPGRAYRAADRPLVAALGVGCGLVSVVVLALYIQDPATARLYDRPGMIWLACPILLYWVARAWVVTHRGGMREDPVLFALHDRASIVSGVLFLLVFYLAA